MNDERKEFLGREFVLNRKIDIEELKKLDIQETIFLVFTTKHFMKDNFITDIALEDKIKLFRGELIRKIKGADELFVTYNKKTNYPHIDKEGRGWFFSKLEYAKSAEEYYSKQEIMLETKVLDKNNIVDYLVQLYYLGIEELLFDNGEYTEVIKRGEILPPPDYSNVPDIQKPVYNPKVQFSIIKFFQELFYKGAYRDKEKILHQLENNMLTEVIKGRYLVPMQVRSNKPLEVDENGIVKLDEHTSIAFGSVSDKDNNSWLPAFTDWREFEKAFDKNIWQGNIMSYEDLLLISKEDGIVINCKGVPLQINSKVKEVISLHKEN